MSRYRSSSFFFFQIGGDWVHAGIARFDTPRLGANEKCYYRVSNLAVLASIVRSSDRLPKSKNELERRLTYRRTNAPYNRLQYRHMWLKEQVIVRQVTYVCSNILDVLFIVHRRTKIRWIRSVPYLIGSKSSILVSRNSCVHRVSKHGKVH